MVDFSYPHSATAGTAIEASKHNDNWNEVKNFINGDAGNPSTYPGLLRAVNPSASGTLTATGTVSLGATNHLYLNSTQHNVIGLSTGTDINAQTAGSFLKDLNYRANFTSSGPGNNTHQLSYGSDIASGPYAGNYLSESHRYSVYSRRAGEGYTGPYDGRPASEYRLVVNGSIAVRGDIIGYTGYNESVPGTSSDYLLGEGTRLNVNWANVWSNIDCGGEIRVGSRFQTATLYFGDEYSLNQDYIQWKDNLPTTNLPGFQFVHNDTAHLTIAESSGNLDLRAAAGWPTLASTTSAGITTTGSNQLGIVSSSERYKEDITDVDLAAAKTKIAALTPRTFKWDAAVSTASGIDYQNQTPETGFIAEEVAAVAPDWVSYDSSDLPQTWRHQSVVSALVAVVQDLENRVGALE